MKIKNIYACVKYTILAAAVCMLMVHTMDVSAATIVSDASQGREAEVSTSKELKAALNDDGVSKITFLNDIEAEEAMPIEVKRVDGTLLIDGNGYQFVERYVKTAKTTNGIYFTGTKATTDAIIIQNMNIIGQSKYGTIYSSQEVRQEFHNVTYTGPKMVHNAKSSVLFKDCDIKIAQDAYGTAIGEMAEAYKVYFDGNVTIDRADGSTSDILSLKSAGEVVVAENANVEIVNHHDDGGKGLAKASAFISAGAKYDFIIRKNAKFDYKGTFTFEKTCSMKDFVMEEDAVLNIDILGNSGKYITKAYYGSASIADRAKYTVNIDGDSGSKVLYGKNGVTVGNDAEININIGGKTTAHVIKSLCGDVIFGERTKVTVKAGGDSKSYILYSCKDMRFGEASELNVDIAGNVGHIAVRCAGTFELAGNAQADINVNGNNGCTIMYVTKNIDIRKAADLNVQLGGESQAKAVKSACAGMTIEDDASVVIQSNGKVKYSLLYICKNLIVENNARLDLIALNNTNTTTCEELLYICGGTLAFRNPERVLVYNDSRDLKKSKPVFLGCNITVDIDVYSTKYWVDAATSGGHMVLENPDFEWAQSGNYQIDAKTALGKFKTFNVNNYYGEQPLTASDYFFCSKAHRAYLWQGAGAEVIEEVTLTYDMNNPYPENDGRVPEEPVSETYIKDMNVTIADNMFDGAEWSFVGWNTAADGSGVDYLPGAELAIGEDTVLYARWKSLTPEINTVVAGVANITGTGVPGALVEIVLPDGNTATGTVNSAGNWNIRIPTISQPVEKGDVIEAYQTEPNKLKSDKAEKIVVDGRE